MASVEEWVDKALWVLGTQGVEAVRVEPLAVSLGVTKGSFYWHFRDRKALLSALLARWEALATQAIIDELDAAGGSAAERLTMLVMKASQNSRAAGVEQAIRAWGARDPDARAVLGVVDVRREAYVRKLLVEHGLSRARAAQRARILYLALVGEFSFVSHGSEPSGTGPWKELAALVLG